MLDQVQLNKIEEDEFGRINGVFAVNKPKDMNSHGVVNIVRKKLGTRKVGHAGALDPFATGVLLILAGKYTKATEELMTWDKEYKCKILLGVTTDTLDTEGVINEICDKPCVSEIDIEYMMSKLNDIQNGYDQTVPVFSSIKVGGIKLREIARKADTFTIDEEGLASFLRNGEVFKQIPLPSRQVKFSKFIFTDFEHISVQSLSGDMQDKIKIYLESHDMTDQNIELATVDLTVGCSKGTYIRQLAFDIGRKLAIPAMLIELQRTRLGKITLDLALSPEEIPEYKPKVV